MEGQTVTKISKAQFLCRWIAVPNSELVINFNPIISAHNLQGAYCLIHWQAKPKGLRTWGVYDSEKDMYFSIGAFSVDGAVVLSILDVSERTVKTVPTAVIQLHGCSFNEVTGKVESNYV